MRVVFRCVVLVKWFLLCGLMLRLLRVRFFSWVCVRLLLVRVWCVSLKGLRWVLVLSLVISFGLLLVFLFWVM